MRILFILTLLSVFSLPFRVRIFEALVWSLLTTPIWGFLFNSLIGVSAPSYYLILLINFLGWCFLRRGELDKPAHEKSEELITFAAFIVTYIFTYSFIMQWNEFFPIGERLRDYALLSSVMRSPIDLQEPWLHGSSLNYYAYWYRFGHFIATILNLPATDVYNQLQALTFTLFTISIFRLTTRFLSWTPVGGAFIAIFIAFGSNLQGIFNALIRDDNWWGPSRVIEGAINEFPVWSFLLGDLHPHYLNLAMIPLLIILFLHLAESRSKITELLDLGLRFLLLGVLLIYNANAWEVPIWGGTIVGIVAVLAALKYLASSNTKPAYSSNSKHYWLKYSGLFAISLLLLFSLYRSSRNIEPNPYPISFVKNGIPGSTILEFLKHWGVPTAMTIIALLASPLTFTNNRTTYTITPLVGFIALIAIILTGQCYPLLWAIMILTILQMLKLFLIDKEEDRTGLYFACLFTAIGAFLCLIPEYIFLDDPYGGENERMNTIFKIYSSNWFIFHLGAFALIRESAKEWKTDIYTSHFLIAATLILGLAFFASTIKLRRTPDRGPNAHYGSLADADEKFPGSAESIIFLRSQPEGIILEAQGNPYNWTSFISTLSDKDSYLGWANHVELLTRKYDLINRRKDVTNRFYNSTSCEEKKQILNDEGIDYAVVGSLEATQHPATKTSDFSCLKELFSNREYRIYGINHP